MDIQIPKTLVQHKLPCGYFIISGKNNMTLGRSIKAMDTIQRMTILSIALF